MVFSAIVTFAWFIIYVYSVCNYSQQDIFSGKTYQFILCIKVALFIILFGACFRIIWCHGKSGFIENEPLKLEDNTPSQKIGILDKFINKLKGIFNHKGKSKPKDKIYYYD
ncbi:MAG: hypothetical protein K0U45_06740 [Alphaproteobacteria bacterium]|nr:hypothetical protein [Alphaproteobacteria bacterium]